MQGYRLKNPGVTFVQKPRFVFLIIRNPIEEASPPNTLYTDGESPPKKKPNWIRVSGVGWIYPLGVS